MKYNIKYFSKVTHEKPCSFALHTHECYELVYYASGKGTVKYKDKLLEYTAGDIIIVEPNTLHDETNFHKSINIVLGFHPERNENIPLGKFTVNLNLKNILESMLDETVNQYPNHQEIINKQFELFFLYLTRPKINEKEKNFISMFNNIENYVEENLGSPINIESFAKTYNYSSSHFRHTFTKQMKVSPKQYIMQKRLSKSQKLLRETKKSVTEIAYECGFYDTAQFSRLFKKNFSISPSEYRK